MVHKIALFGQGHIGRLIAAGSYGMHYIEPKIAPSTVLAEPVNTTIMSAIPKRTFEITQDFRMIMQNNYKSLVDIYKRTQEKCYPEKDVFIKTVKDKKVF